MFVTNGIGKEEGRGKKEEERNIEKKKLKIIEIAL